MLAVKFVKVVYGGREYEIAQEELRVTPATVEELKQTVEQMLELPPGALDSYTASEVEGRWVIAPTPVYG